MMRRAFVVLATLATFGFPADSARAESRYSLRGYGEPVFPAPADVRALGAAEAASRIPTLSGNPASLALADRVRFTGSYFSEWVKTEELQTDLSVRDRQEYNHAISNLGLIYPLPRNFALATGLLVSRRRGGQIEQTAMTPDGVSYLQQYEADGNLLRVPLLAAWKGDYFEVGFGPDLVLFNGRDRWENSFDSGLEIRDSNDLDKRTLFGASWRGGVRVPLDRWGAIGVWGSLPQEVKGDRVLENDDPSDDSDDLTLSVAADLPATVSFGIEATPHADLRLLADWTRESWSEVEAGEILDPLTDVDRLAVGVEWTWRRASGLTLPVRGGFRTENLHFLDARGEEVQETTLSVGSGVGFAGGRGQFDWFLEYGWRGDSAETEFGETFYRFGLSLAGFESWTRRRPPEAEEDDW